ncbi:MAG: hypothetical protein U9R14_04495 [Patescibacteria group bacterium]|nr:hypothetical protein [Patescibacteria group bacterium]
MAKFLNKFYPSAGGLEIKKFSLFMKRKTITKIIWIFLSIMIIFTMVLWTVGLAFM